MEDDRRPSGPGEPSSAAPSGEYDGRSGPPEPSAEPYSAPAPEPGSGGPPASAAEPQKPHTPGPAAQAPGSTGWQPVSPSSPYTIPAPAPQAPGADGAPGQPPSGADPFAAPDEHRPAAPETPLHGNAATPREPAPDHNTAPGHTGTPDDPAASTGGGHTHSPHNHQPPAPDHSTAPEQSTTPGYGHAPGSAGQARPADDGYTRAPHGAQAAASEGRVPASTPAGGDSGDYGGPPVPPSFEPAYTGGAPDPADEPRRSRTGLIVGVVGAAVVLALVGGGASWYVLTMPQPEDTVTSYAQAWNSQDYAAMAGLAEGGEPAEVFGRLDENLGVDAVQVSTGPVEEGDGTATAAFDATLDLSSAGEWSYSGELPLVHTDGEWKVDFSPAAVHPDLGDGQTLMRTNQWGERGHVLAADGSRLDDGSASGSVQMIVGEVGTASEEDLEDLGPAYQAGDPVGVSGAQQSYEERLAGKAATAIRIGETGTESADLPEDAPTVATLGGSDGTDVTLSLDPAVQAAASQAIVGQSKPTAITAVRPSTGEVLAAANVPGGFNRALEGQYPAGSIFKIISYHALLSSGMGMGAQMSCPETVDVGGRTYKNAGDAAYGAQSVTEAFATSCNTALVQEVADRLDGASLLDSAERFGFNTGFASGIDVFKPSLPQPDSVSLLTASSIGQGQVLTSPLHLASLPAAVADGSWRAPLLVTDPAPAERPEPRPLDNAQSLRDMTRAVVTEGTAQNVGFTGEVHGKSGTAEYGTAEEGEELPAHGWFVGYEDDVAFAVVVEDGDSGSGAAAPLAKAFLDAL
ncbi:penicillin-binding transpeptidase domain-containing protein [Streptomonospora salina]|uniref:penicillin-binding transpeptidase domain-containing protein n=1 Tax=Streptomonospora salina TaxID=104205 RepID=UPI0035E51A63